MKYSILGFNQKEITAYNKDGLKCDLTDLLLLNYIIYAQSSPKMKHILDDDNQPCVWLQHEHILEDLPILNITQGTLKNRLTKLRKMELIASKTVANENTQGSRTYYRTTSFLHDMLFTTTSLENDVKEQPRHLKMTSNNKVNIHNKVEDNSKELYNTQNCTQSFLGSNKKQKKKSLSTQWKEIVDDFTSNEELKKTIWEYISMYNTVMQDKGKVLYANVLKGKLNELTRITSDVSKQIKVLQYSISNGFVTLYSIKDSTNKKFSAKYRVEGGGLKDTKTIDKTEENERFWKELEESGKTAVY